LRAVAREDRQEVVWFWALPEGNQMLRAFGGVVVGYIVMTILAIAIFTCAYLALGVDRVFEPETYDITTLWMVVVVVVSLILGVVGGFICAAISKKMGVCKVFAGIVLVLGLLSAIVTTMKERPVTARSGDVPNFEAMQMAHAPAWLSLLNSVLPAVGIPLGARMKKLSAT
jgi:hypothetical protein